MVRLPAGQPRRGGRLGDAEVRQLQHQDESVLGPELQVTRSSPGRARLIGLLLAAAARLTLHAQTPEEQVRSALAAVGEASFVEKEALADRIAASGHPAARAI